MTSYQRNPNDFWFYSNITLLQQCLVVTLEKKVTMWMGFQEDQLKWLTIMG